MKLEVIDPNQLTYKQILEGLDDMYMLVPQDPAELGIMDRTKPIPELEPFRIFGDERDDGEKIIFKVIFDENDTPSSNAEEMPFPEETVESRDKPLRTNIRMDYKINAESHDKSIFVEVRPKGDIRVSFKDHEDAKVYHEYFRDLFYRAYSECDAVTVATIYSELHLDLDEISRRDQAAWEGSDK